MKSEIKHLHGGIHCKRDLWVNQVETIMKKDIKVLLYDHWLCKVSSGKGNALELNRISHITASKRACDLILYI